MKQTNKQLLNVHLMLEDLSKEVTLSTTLIYNILKEIYNMLWILNEEKELLVKKTLKPRE